MGLAQQTRPAADHITTMTTIAGTNGFMDDHYQTTGRFDASADGYAMGVTLLVLLTCMPAIHPLLGHVVDRCDVEEEDIASLADKRAQWPEEVAREVYKVGMALVRRNRERRITVTVARQRVEALVEAHLPAASREVGMAERECIMCMSAPRHVRFACGHSQLCRGCVRIYLQRLSPSCTLCRAPVSQDGLIVSDTVSCEDTFVRQRR